MSCSEHRWKDGQLNPAYRPPCITTSQSSSPLAHPVPRAALLQPECMRSEPYPAPLLKPRHSQWFPPPRTLAVDQESSTNVRAPEPLCAMPFPPPLVSASSVSSCTMREALQAAMHHQVGPWLDICKDLVSDSVTVRDLAATHHRDSHLARIVRMYAPSTLEAYLSKWRTWADFARLHGQRPACPELPHLLDFLCVHATGKLKTASNWLKALRMVAKHLQLPILDTLAAPVVAAYGKSAEICARREAAPLPLSFIVWLEQQVLRPSSSARRRLEAGSLLLCIVASLRWSDGLWASPQQIHLSSDTVLGTCARTKTTRRSMPFAAVAHGLLTSPADAQGWGHVFVRALQEAAHQTKLRKPECCPDFLLAHLGDDERCPLLVAPMQRHAGVLLIRRLLLECYGHLGEHERPDLDLIGAHSLKATLLAFAKQLLLPDNLRREQGHHADATAAMPALYGQDDISGPLQLQGQVFDAIAGGFRPLRFSMRGARPPMPDIAVDLPPCARTAKQIPIPALADRPEPVFEGDSSSDSASDALKEPMQACKMN